MSKLTFWLLIIISTYHFFFLGESFADFEKCRSVLRWFFFFVFSGYVRVSARLFLQHFLSPVTDVHVKVFSSAAVPLELFRLLTPRSLTGQPTNQKWSFLWSCQDARHASNVVELSSWILLIVKRPYAVREKEQGNLLNEEIKLNHNSAGP